MLPLLWKNWPLIAMSLIVAFFAHNYFQKGLFKIPGPFLGALSNWYRLYYVVSGRRQDLQQQKMHDKYGDIVRYGPNLVMFADPMAIKDIYGISTTLHKSPFYLPQQAMSKGRAFPALFTTLDNKRHSELKRTLTGAFSGSSIVSLEPLVSPVIDRWIEQTKTHYVNPQKACDMGWWVQLFAFDVVSNLTYSKTYGLVDEHRDVGGIIAWLEGMFFYGAVVSIPHYCTFHSGS